MKRLLILTLALATMLALAAPVGAAKPARLELDVTIESNLWWANAPGDTIVYTIEVETASGYETWTIETDYGSLDPTECAESPCVLTYEVAGDDLLLDAILNTVTVTFEGDDGEKIIKSATDAVNMSPVEPCQDVNGNAFPDSSFFEVDYGGGACVHEFDYGTWTIVSNPNYSRAGRNPGLTMRDHVPGNWCMDADTVAEGPRPKPTSLTMSVNLPDPFATSRAWEEIGVCTELGGHGACTEPDCYLPVGNPHSFVLVAPPGTLTAFRP